MADVVPLSGSQVATTGELLFRDTPATSGALLLGDTGAANTPQVATTGELLFRDPPATSGALLFGDGSTAPPAPSDVTLAIAGAFPALTARVLASASIEARIAGQFAPLTATATAYVSSNAFVSGSFAPLSVTAFGEYDSNTQRPLVCKTDAPWQVAAEHQAGATWAHQGATPAPAGRENLWQPATNLGAHFATRHRDSARLRQHQEGHYQDATGLHNGASSSHQDAERIKRLVTVAYQNATSLRAGQQLRHQEGTRIKRARTLNFAGATPLHKRLGSDFQVATPAFWQWEAWHQDAVPPPPGISKGPGPGKGREPCYTPNAMLLFADPWEHSATLLFACPGKDPGPGKQPIIVPVRRVYFVLNNVNLRRVIDNTHVRALQMSLSLDASSWTWSFSALLPEASQALVEPTSSGLVELKAHVNGTDFHVLVESVQRERTFGQTTLQVTGRGRNAFLDAPFAPQQVFSNTDGRTSQQLLDDVLTFNGIPLGYSIDYGLEPWFVPAGVFNHQGTYIGALSALVQAGGGYLIPHPSDLAFKVRHLYPTAPWDAPKADIVLPSAVVTRESVAWVKKPAYNRVYVSGQEQGVLGQVTRAGTSGDMLAPMVTDPLITSVVAARQRGLAVLGDTGAQLEMRLSLPVLTATGIVQPGTYVQYEDESVVRTGIVRSVQVDVGGLTNVWQSLGVTFHV